MRKLLLAALFLGVLFFPHKAHASAYPLVQITTGTLQAGTTWGFYTSSGTVTQFIVTSTFSAHGTVTNDSARTGFIGEYISSSTSAGVFASISTGSWQNVVSIPLTPGDWDVTGEYTAGLISGTMSRVQYAVSSFSGATTTDQLIGDNQSETCLPLASFNCGGAISSWRVSIAANTTYYLKTFLSSNISPQNVAARLSGRRAR